ncbi:cysteine synthase family protein (plasmid) [Embleya sp. NBC_00888]|uniref:PLP-dependent cysteine synthase family protein n=1 Tax=Embleya sp. NBC_00888 TaxID=2975960 RepID=UPI002F913066|nr:cysteine synthase family protein [Embleya sp. NBC_00888]
MNTVPAPRPAPGPAEAVVANPDLLALLGRTPLVRIGTALPCPQPGFWAKLEYLSAGGMKARAAVSMLRGARRRGELRPGALVVESTSGTLGVGLAFAGQALGHPVRLVCDGELEPSMRQLLRAHGAALEVVDRPASTGGWQAARLARVREILRGTPDAYWPDQYNNPDNPSGYASMAAELVDGLEHVDVLVCSVGTGGHSAGLIGPLRRRWPALTVIGVDSVGSTIFGQPARPRLMRGLGSSIHPRNVAHHAFDEVHWVGPAAAVDTCRRLARGSFVSGGWSTGAVALVAAWAARVHRGATVVGVFPDGPHRYLGTVYDDDFCRTHGLDHAVVPTHPVEILHPRAVEVAGWARCRRVDDPRPSRRTPAPPTPQAPMSAPAPETATRGTA